MDSNEIAAIFALRTTIPFILACITILLAVAIKLPLPSVFRAKIHQTVYKPVNPRLTSVSEDCPYEYLLNIYGKYHFAGFVRKLSPSLELSNPKKWHMVLEIMDGIHFCLILVDDITDNSELRKGRPAAHKIFGSSETANRAYLSLTRIMNKTLKEQKQLIPFLLQNLEEVLEGQDMSLVWRRDGIRSLPLRHEDRVTAYRRCASLKTGALFRLVGQLVTEDHSNDELMARVGWYCQLQNDCKNVYSSEYAKLKGTYAEDLWNGEFSYPIILALNHPQGDYVAKALQSGTEEDIMKALAVVQSDAVRNECLGEMKQIGSTVTDFIGIWGRKEKLDAKA
ncbi:prenyl transferase [Trichophaea hybrida]|nr:prenyl transferase [Trichophaea hybrida]